MLIYRIPNQPLMSLDLLGAELYCRSAIFFCAFCTA
jgi:hypothetical protein